MENASKALIMAAGVLIGVIIIAIGTIMFRSFSSFGNATYQKVEDARIEEWNTNYTKYYGKINIEGYKDPVPIPVTSHDIVSIANLAKQNNIDYEFYGDEVKAPTEDAKKEEFYVQVIIEGDGKWNSGHFEAATDEKKKEFIKENSLDAENNIKYYECSGYEISDITKKVYQIRFKPHSCPDVFQDHGNELM